jgi:hypothetical protein
LKGVNYKLIIKTVLLIRIGIFARKAYPAQSRTLFSFGIIHWQSSLETLAPDGEPVEPLREPFESLGAGG